MKFTNGNSTAIVDTTRSALSSTHKCTDSTNTSPASSGSSKRTGTLEKPWSKYAASRLPPVPSARAAQKALLTTSPSARIDATLPGRSLVTFQVHCGTYRWLKTSSNKAEFRQRRRRPSAQTGPELHRRQFVQRPIADYNRRNQRPFADANTCNG